MEPDDFNKPSPNYSKTALRRDGLSQPDKEISQTQIPDDGHPDEIEDILFTLEDDDQ